MDKPIPIYVGNEAIPELVAFCRQHDLTQFALIADENTYPVLGAMVTDALKRAGAGVLDIVLHGEVLADEHYVVQVLAQLDDRDCTLLTVGSGTLTDICRFVSHRTRRRFISLPTAPSVDGFVSIGAPLVLEGLKQTVICKPPLASFSHLPTLTSAPRRMIAAGFGDMIGKLLSVADWKLGHLLRDEPYDQALALEFAAAAQTCLDAAGEIGSGSAQGIRNLMLGLIDSGFGMLAFGNTAPASGAEHHMSHYWETKLLRENRPALLHGAKVGVASILAARRYKAIGKLTRDQVAQHLRDNPPPDRETQIRCIRSVYGPLAEQIIRDQASFLDLAGSAQELLHTRIVDEWSQVQDIARQVPEPADLARALQSVGGPADARGLGLSDADVQEALDHAHYFRNRLTINKLWFYLGLSHEE